MIFLTVGTQLPFDRLVRSVDQWAASHPDILVRAQVGAVAPGGYHPEHMQSAASVPPTEYDTLCSEAQLIVAHAGTGSFIKAQSLGTPILAMPRKGALGEHRNDHQMATAAHFEARDGIFIARDEAEIGPLIDRLLAAPPAAPNLSSFAEDSLLEAVRQVVFPEAKA